MTHIPGRARLVPQETLDLEGAGVSGHPEAALRGKGEMHS
jgi:hypothetical protein